MAKPLKIKAFKINQKTKKDREVFLASIPVELLIDPTYFKVNWWDKDKRGLKNQGYQRVPTESRKKKISDYLANHPQPIFPTNIVVSSRSKIKFDRKDDTFGEIFISDANYPLWIVDGQTRIEGFKYFVNELGDKSIKNYEMPVIIMSNLELIEELEQFYVLNTNQKKVSTDLAQRLKLELARDDQEKFKMLKIGELWELQAILAVDELNSKPDSTIWKGRIQLPNTQKSPINIVSQNSLITSLKPLYKDGLLGKIKNVDTCYKILRDYWEAVRQHFPDAFVNPKEYVIQKTPGIFILHNLGEKVLNNLYYKGEDLDVKNIYRELSIVVKAEGLSANWWMADGTGAALAGSMKGFGRNAERMKDSLPDLEIKK